MVDQCQAARNQLVCLRVITIQLQPGANALEPRLVVGLLLECHGKWL